MSQCMVYIRIILVNYVLHCSNIRIVFTHHRSFLHMHENTWASCKDMYGSWIAEGAKIFQQPAIRAWRKVAEHSNEAFTVPSMCHFNFHTFPETNMNVDILKWTFAFLKDPIPARSVSPFLLRSLRVCLLTLPLTVWVPSLRFKSFRPELGLQRAEAFGLKRFRESCRGCYVLILAWQECTLQCFFGGILMDVPIQRF